MRLTYNQGIDGGTFEESNEPCKLTWWDLSTMAKKCLAKERKCIDDGKTLEAIKYVAIWHRIMKAMLNPDKFFGK